MANPKMDINAVQEMLANADFGQLGEYFTKLAHHDGPQQQQQQQAQGGLPLPPNRPAPASAPVSPIPPSSAYNPYHNYPHSSPTHHVPSPSHYSGVVGGYSSSSSGAGYSSPCPCVNPACRHGGAMTPPAGYNGGGSGRVSSPGPYGGGSSHHAHNNSRAYHNRTPHTPNAGYNPTMMPRGGTGPHAIDVPYGRASVRQPGECRVYVGNLPMQTAQCELAALFSPFGELLEVFVLRRANPHTGGRGAFVRFARVADATQAVQALDGLEWRSRRITVRLAPVGTSANDMIPASGAFTALMGMFAHATAAQQNGEAGFARGSSMDLMQQLAPMMQEFLQQANTSQPGTVSEHSSPVPSPAPSPQPPQSGQTGGMADIIQQMQKVMQSMSGTQFSSPNSTPEPSPLPMRGPSPSMTQGYRGTPVGSEPSSAATSTTATNPTPEMDPSQVSELLPLLVNFLMGQATGSAPAAA